MPNREGFTPKEPKQSSLFDVRASVQTIHQVRSRWMMFFVCLLVVLAGRSWAQTPDPCDLGEFIEIGESCSWTGERGSIEVSVGAQSTVIEVDVDGKTGQIEHTFGTGTNRIERADTVGIISRGFGARVDDYGVTVSAYGNTRSNELRLVLRDDGSLRIMRTPDLDRR